MDEKTDYMTHCDSDPEFQDTPHGSVRCFHLEGGGYSGAFNRLTGTKQSEAVKWFHALWTETLFVTMVAAHLTSRQGGKKNKKNFAPRYVFDFQMKDYLSLSSFERRCDFSVLWHISQMFQ